MAAYGTSAAFFVTIWGLTQRYAETHDRMTAGGCTQVYSAAPLRWKYSDVLLPYFLQDLPHKVYEDAGLVRDAFRLWADDRSREEYLGQVRYRALGDFYGLSAPDCEPSYFLDSLYALRPGEVFIDCGAYHRDTLRGVLHRSGCSFSRIVALEPDPKSFEVLQRYVASLPPATRSRITVYPYAVSSMRRRLPFDASGEVTARISASGDAVVDAVPLDELVLDLAPTFVKMDIEGAEVEALEGARQLISKYRPILPICLYHRQNDLWRIPLLIHSIYPGYRHYLRAHETDGWQTVEYAVPVQRLKAAIVDNAPVYV
jgi:FkbM family methyltransferase